MTILPISVIVCTHNRAALLPNVLNRLCEQDYPLESFEIIIVDNASTDDTAQVVQRFKPDRKLTLRFVQETRLGVTFARNRGAEEARYPYLAYLDDDCSVGRDWLSQLASGFGLSDQVSVVAGRVTIDIGDQKMPAWLGHKSERWLADFNFPSSGPRLLENPTYICEGNMAIKKQAWQSAGGFLGMDQFGSPHMASQEIVFLLEQIKRHGDRVAFVPDAIVNHQTIIPSWWQLVQRAYFHGTSTALLNHLLKRYSGSSSILHFVLDSAAFLAFLFLSLAYLLVFDIATATYQFLRAAGRTGKILGSLRLTGDWRRVKSWASTHRTKKQASKRVFIAWKQYQRRVEVMSPYLGAEHFYFHHTWEMRSPLLKALSYLPKTVNTLRCLFNIKPALVFVQFPPTPALYAVAFYSWLSGARYISDCHIGVTNARWLHWPFAKKLLANGKVIVHNEHLVRQVEVDLRVKPFVLRDGITRKHADLCEKSSLLHTLGLSPKEYVIFPCSFSADEPMKEVIEAARLLPELMFVMTWHTEKLEKAIRNALPKNVLLTGFLNAKDFDHLFANAGAALVLTVHEGVQLSGVQEAMAFEIPAVVSDLKTTRFLYRDFPVYVKTDSESIAQGITFALQNRTVMECRMKALRIESEREFLDQVNCLQSVLGS